jgi:hypothetical protein
MCAVILPETADSFGIDYAGQCARVILSYGEHFDSSA